MVILADASDCVRDRLVFALMKQQHTFNISPEMAVAFKLCCLALDVWTYLKKKKKKSHPPNRVFGTLIFKLGGLLYPKIAGERIHPCYV